MRLLSLFSLIALSLFLSGCGGLNPGSPLIAAARSGDLPALRSLLKSGADPNQTGGVNGWTALQHAIHKGQAGSVTVLLEGGADPNYTGLHNNTTPLMMAAGYGQADIVRQLLKHGADPNRRDTSGKTALDYAKSGVTDIDRFTYGKEQTAALTALEESSRSR